MKTETHCTRNPSRYRSLLHAILTLTLIANVVAAFLLVNRPSGTEPARAAASAVEVSQAAAPPWEPSTDGPTSVTNISHLCPPFRWAELESPDYPTYIARLRGIGCPEATVRDIITADLHAAFDAKRAAVLATEPRKFWQHDFASAEIPEVKAFDAEEADVLAKLLGDPTASAIVAAGSAADSGDFKLGPTLSYKQSAIQAWWQNYMTQREAVLAGTESRELTAPELTALEAVELAREANLNSLLIPEEREEFDLRNSPSAEVVRQGLVGFEVTEPEFRQLVQVRQDYDRFVEELGKSGGGDLQEAWQALQAQVAGVLGTERTTLMRNAENPRFQELWQEASAENWSQGAFEETVREINAVPGAEEN